MDQSDGMTRAIGAWQASLDNLVVHSGEIARMTSLAFDEESQDRTEALVADLIGASDQVFEFMMGPLDEEDADAQDRLFGLVYGSLAAVGALTSASENPEFIAADLRLASVEAFPEDSWHSEIQTATAIVSAIPGAGGGAGSPYQPELDETMSTLSDAAGGELRSVVTDGLVLVAIPKLPVQVADVIGGKAGKTILDATKAIKGIFAAAKRAAGRIVEWVVAHVHKIVPKQLQPLIETFIHQKLDELQDKIDSAIGDLAARFLGRNTVESRWMQAGDAKVIAAIPKIPGAIEGPKTRIDQVTRCRSFVDKWLKSLISLAKAPHVAAGIAAVAAAIVILLLYELWRGLHQLAELV